MSRFRVYTVLGFVIFINTIIVYLDRINIAIVAPVLMKNFSWDKGIMGLVMSLFGVGYLLTQIPGGVLADKFGGKKILAIGSFIWSLTTILTPFAKTPIVMYFVRFVLGLAEGVNFPTATSVLAKWLPRNARARFQGLNLSGIAAGPMIATIMTVWIMTTWNWQTVFYVYGTIGLLWCAVWTIYSKDKPQDHKGVSPEELAEIEKDRDLDIVDEVSGSPFSSKAVWGLTLAYFLFTYTGWLFFSWLPTYLVEARGFSIIKMGIFATIPNLAAFVSMQISGWASDALVKRGFTPGKARRVLIYIGVPGLAIFTWLASQAGSAYTAVAMITIAMFLSGLNYPSFWSLPIDMHMGKAGAISGIMNMGSALSAILAPGVTGFVVMAWGWTAALTFASLTALIAVGVIYFTRPKTA